MKVVSCNPGEVEVSVKLYNGCTFEVIDKWDPAQHAKTCDTMFYLKDGTGAYVWDCDQWLFLDFSGATQADWNTEENEAGGIKNKPFSTLDSEDFEVLDGELKVKEKAIDWEHILNKPDIEQTIVDLETGLTDANASIDIVIERTNEITKDVYENLNTNSSAIEKIEQTLSDIENNQEQMNKLILDLSAQNGYISEQVEELQTYIGGLEKRIEALEQ